jgi:hypothetical protein
MMGTVVPAVRPSGAPLGVRAPSRGDALARAPSCREVYSSRRVVLRSRGLAVDER